MLNSFFIYCPQRIPECYFSFFQLLYLELVVFVPGLPYGSQFSLTWNLGFLLNLSQAPVFSHVPVCPGLQVVTQSTYLLKDCFPQLVRGLLVQFIQEVEVHLQTLLRCIVFKFLLCFSSILCNLFMIGEIFCFGCIHKMSSHATYEKCF